MRALRFIRLLVICASSMVVACASLVNGTTQAITVNSNVMDAQVLFNGQVIGRTPLTMKVRRGGGRLTVQKPGYAPHTVHLQSNVSGWFWANIISGGTLGSSTDWASGGMYEYSPDSFFASLVPEEGHEYDVLNGPKDAELLHYCMVNYERLAHDIAVGAGEHLDGLLTLEHSLADADLESIRRTSKDIPTFAMAVLAAARGS